MAIDVDRRLDSLVAEAGLDDVERIPVLGISTPSHCYHYMIASIRA